MTDEVELDKHPIKAGDEPGELVIEDMPGDIRHKLKYEPSFRGPLGKRDIRDLGWLVLFILFWVGMFVIAYLGVERGNPARY